MKKTSLTFLVLALLSSLAVGQDFFGEEASLKRDSQFIEWVKDRSRERAYSVISDSADSFIHSGELPPTKATALHFDRIAYSHYKVGRFEKAITVYENDVHFWELIEDHNYVFAMRARYGKALTFAGSYERSKSVLKELLITSKDVKDSVNTLRNLALVYWEARNFKAYEKAAFWHLELTSKGGDNTKVLDSFEFLMALETDIRRDGAKTAGYLVQYNERLKDEHSAYYQILPIVYRGLVFKLLEKNYSRAISHLDSALVQAKSANEYFWEWAIYREYGRLYRELNDYGQADAWFNKMLALAQSRDDFITENKAHAELLETHVASGDVLGMHKAFIPLADRYQLFKYPELTRQYFHHTQRDHWLFYELRLFWNWAGLWLLLGLGVTLLAVIIRLARKKRWLPIVPYQWYRFIPVVGEKWALQAEVVQWPMLKSNTTIRPEAGKTVKSVDEAVAAVALDHELLARALEPYEEQFRLEIALREDTESKFIWATEQIESYQSFHATLPPEFIPPPIADQFTKYSDDQLMAMYNRVKALRKQNWPNWPGNVSNPHPEA